MYFTSLKLRNSDATEFYTNAIPIFFGEVCLGCESITIGRSFYLILSSSTEHSLFYDQMIDMNILAEKLQIKTKFDFYLETKKKAKSVITLSSEAQAC